MDNNIKILEEHFQNLCNDIKSWLSFGEAKNAALIVFNIAVFTTLLNEKLFQYVLFKILLILLIFSTLISLVSFFPNNSSVAKINRNIIKYHKHRNLIFGYDIASFNSEKTFIKATIKKYFPSLNYDYNSNKKCNDLAREIVINSRIGKNKYILFTVALSIDMFILIGLIILFFLRSYN